MKLRFLHPPRGNLRCAPATRPQTCMESRGGAAALWSRPSGHRSGGGSASPHHSNGILGSPNLGQPASQHCLQWVPLRWALGGDPQICGTPFHSVTPMGSPMVSSRMDP